MNDYHRNQQSGEWVQYANFVDCVRFGELSDYMRSALHKGAKVAIEGRLHYMSWEKDGQKRSKIEVIVERIELLSQGAQQAQQQQPYNVPQQQVQQTQQVTQYAQPSSPAPQPQEQPTYSTPPTADVYDEDIPF